MGCSACGQKYRRNGSAALRFRRSGPTASKTPPMTPGAEVTEKSQQQPTPGVSVANPEGVPDVPVKSEN